MDLITGERIQQLANVYIGEEEDFCFNPLIRFQKNKHAHIEKLQGIKQWNNPPIVFFYTHRIKQVSNIINMFMNPVILLSHNSDENIIENEYSLRILECPRVVSWHSQNVCFKHDKLKMLPIGIANSMWAHGNLAAFYDKPTKKKKHQVFFNFNIQTNASVRQPCYDSLKNIYEFLPNLPPVQNHIRLSEYKYCIAPEGNGVDTHRLWEALYLNVVPVVLNTPFTQTLMDTGIPLVVVDSWSQVPMALRECEGKEYNFDMVYKLPLLYQKLKNERV